MPLSIEDDATELLIRRVAKLTGESLTDAVRIAMEERYQRLTRRKSGRTLGDELNEIALRCASRPAISNLTVDEVLGYDESGIPTR